MTEAAAMQHLRRVRARKEQAAGLPPRVVLTSRDFKWWETAYERLMFPTVRESRYIPSRKESPPPSVPVKHTCMDCEEDISGLVNHQKRKRCESCQNISDNVVRHRFQKKRRAAERRKRLPRFCACGTDISDRHGRAFRCKSCSRLTRSKGVGALNNSIETKRVENEPLGK